MKNFSFLIAFLLFFANQKSFSQTVLNAGDIAIIGIKTNTSTQSGNDAVKLLTLVDLTCGTSFIVTDNNRRNNGTWYCNNDEFAVQLTVNAKVLAGSVIYIDVETSGGGVSSSTGSLSKTSLGGDWGTNFGLNSGGDNITVLQGTRAAPVFICALRHVGTFASGGDCDSKNNTALPAGLTLGTSAVQMASSQNQWHYNCSGTISGTRAAILSAIGNSANWTSAGGQSWNSSSCGFTVVDAYNPDGVMGISGAGCGCLAGCNLTAFGGPDCGATGVAGSCATQTMTRDINVPAGCTYTVMATMRNWQNCTASGSDSGDGLRVDVPSGAKPNVSGSSNGTINDSYTLTGPGVIRITGIANRADEIVAYWVIGSPCSTCDYTILPVDLVAFDAKQAENAVVLTWQTASESNSEYFEPEKSSDGVVWKTLSRVSAAGNSQRVKTYLLYDTEPHEGIGYYRLRQRDFNGQEMISKIVSVNFRSEKTMALDIKNLNHEQTEISLFLPEKEVVRIAVYDVSGRLVLQKDCVCEGGENLMSFRIPAGLHFISAMTSKETVAKKFLVE